MNITAWMENRRISNEIYGRHSDALCISFVILRCIHTRCRARSAWVHAVTFCMSGVNVRACWKELLDANFESGHAYAKALRTVKSCVGSSWCRFGVRDSVSLAMRGEAIPAPPCIFIWRITNGLYKAL